MCRSHDQGHRRCKGSAETKAHESLRKAINYQAAKAGVSVDTWKEQNPDLLEAIKGTYQERLDKFSEMFKDKDEALAPAKPLTSLQKLKNMLAALPQEPKKVEPIGYIDDNGEALATGVQTPEDAAKQHPIENYGFAAKGEKRTTNLPSELHLYTQSCRKQSAALNLTEQEELAISHYTYDLYKPLNKYFILGDKPKEHLFDEGSLPWNDEDGGQYNYQFKNEDDFVDCVTKLDSALSHRTEEPRVLYRGLKVRYDSRSMREMNNGEYADDIEQRKQFMEQMYTPGEELAFDAYSSASESITVAANWCNAGSTWENDTGVLFEIKSSAGVPIAHLSGHTQEREVLMPRGLRFKVVNSYWNGNTNEECYRYDGTFFEEEAKNTGTLIVQLIEVDESGNEIEDHASKHVAPNILPVK